jgi:ribose 5-phosphate isomerase B
MGKIAIGSDHAGFEMKEKVKVILRNLGHEVNDYGTHSVESVDYPDFAHPVANAVEKGEYELGVLICGSANGVAMAANKHQGIRAAICWNEELATLARQHNNANILCLPARFISMDLAEKIVESFFSAHFEGGRHERRVDKISC